MYQTLLLHEPYAVPEVHDSPVTGVLVEVKESLFATSSKKRLRVSVVSASVTEALRVTDVSPVYPALLMVVESSVFNWVGEVGLAGVEFPVIVTAFVALERISLAASESHTIINFPPPLSTPSPVHTARKFAAAPSLNVVSDPQVVPPSVDFL